MCNFYITMYSLVLRTVLGVVFNGKVNLNLKKNSEREKKRSCSQLRQKHYPSLVWLGFYQHLIEK